MADQFRKYCLWRGSEENAKKPPKAALKMITLPKGRGMGVLDHKVRNDALLLKNFINSSIRGHLDPLIL
jgi:hypothetical protein